MPEASFPLLAQSSITATRPGFFALVVISLLLAGGIGWLIAAVLGFARARAFGPSARWFSYAAVCLIIYHIHFLLVGVVTFITANDNSADYSIVLDVGAFFNLFVVVGAICSIMGFVRLTNPR